MSAEYRPKPGQLFVVRPLPPERPPRRSGVPCALDGKPQALSCPICDLLPLAAERPVMAALGSEPPARLTTQRAAPFFGQAHAAVTQARAVAALRIIERWSYPNANAL